jgi:hypothetical protein
MDHTWISHESHNDIYYVMGIMEDGTLCEYLLKHHGFLKGFELCKLE